jgi:hypothetical protein
VVEDVGDELVVIVRIGVVVLDDWLVERVVGD